jgi:hypothetical protein
VQVPRGSGPTRDLDIIVLDTPHGEILFSSCDLSIFSSKAGSHHDEGMGIMKCDHRGVVA